MEINKVSDFLELVLLVVVSHLVNAGNRTPVLCKSNKYLFPLSMLSLPPA